VLACVGLKLATVRTRQGSSVCPRSQSETVDALTRTVETFGLKRDLTCSLPRQAQLAVLLTSTPARRKDGRATDC